MLDLSNRPIERIEDPRTDTRRDDTPPMTMAELFDADPERAVKIFLDVIEGDEFDVWGAMRGPKMRLLLDKMEQKASTL